MGLLNDEIEVNIASQNKTWYIQKGYQIPVVYKYGEWVTPRGTKIKVKILDLPSASNVKIKYQCDNCGEIKEIKYVDYIKDLRDGKKYCYHCIRKLFYSKENNPNWNPNLTDEERMKMNCRSRRQTTEYINFIQTVMARDNGSCQICGIKNKNNVVHHLDGYSWCVEKRTDLDNGICLCEQCHKKFHSIYGNKHSTKEQFKDFLQKENFNI